MTLLDFVRLTRRNLLLLVLSTLAGLGLAAGYTSLQPTLYAASATGYVVAGSSGTISDAFAGQSLAQSRASSYVTLVHTQGVVRRVSEELGYPVSAGQLSASTVGQSVLFRLTATATDPRQAQQIADAALKATADEAYRLETLNDATIIARNASAQSAASEAARRGQTVGNVPTTITGSVVRMEPLESAFLPSSPIAPDWMTNLLLGTVAGLVLGYLLAFARKGLDTRVRTQRDVEELTGAGVIGVVPEARELARQRRGGNLRELGIASESLRTLRTNLRFINVDDPPTSIVVTSANPGEGKSTVAANLARVLAESGTSTVLLDADLRRPMQDRTFNTDTSVGLSQLLAGDLSLEDALQETDHPLLHLLPAGRIPPNPSELVGSQRMATLIKDLSADHTVIIDAPPLLPVTDAGLLAAAADGAVLIMRQARTRKDHARHSARILGQVGAKLLGVVMNRAPRRGGDEGDYAYGYGYGYTSEYTADTPDETPTSGEAVLVPAAERPVGRRRKQHRHTPRRGA